MEMSILFSILYLVPYFSFFDRLPRNGIIVFGSDSTNHYLENCKSNCNKNCEDACKNANRRIQLYSKYVNRNYEKLQLKYEFFGGLRTEQGILLLPYDKSKQYDAILLFKN